jgi:hypothetical protein
MGLPLVTVERVSRLPRVEDERLALACEHGQLVYDPTCCWYRCPVQACDRMVTDEDLAQTETQP